MAIKVMMLGDSLTAATGALGFKGHLYNALDDAGYDLDYVGSQTSPAVTGQRDPHHEGHSGWQIGADFDNGGTGPGFLTRVGPWVTTYQPDVIVALVGTNDVWSAVAASTALQRHRTMLTQVFAAKPDVIVVACHLPPATPSTGPDPAGTPARRTAFNAGLATEADYWTSQGKRVMVASTGSPELQGDGIHLTAAGHQTVANALYPTVRAALDALDDVPPPPGGGNPVTVTIEEEFGPDGWTPASGTGGGTGVPSGLHTHPEIAALAARVTALEGASAPAIADVTGLSVALAAKADKAAGKLVIRWNGTDWVSWNGTAWVVTVRPATSVYPAGMVEWVSTPYQDAPWPTGAVAGDIVERHPSASAPA